MKQHTKVISSFNILVQVKPLNDGPDIVFQRLRKSSPPAFGDVLGQMDS